MGCCSSSSSGGNLDLLSRKCAPFSLEGYDGVGYCINVYDGDTVRVNIPTMYGPREINVRMMGYDSPEMKSKEPTHKKYALACRDFLKEMIHTKYIRIVIGKSDKYGRLLCNVYIGKIHINELMMTDTPCVPYEGKTKKDFTFDENKYSKAFNRIYQSITLTS